MPNKPFQILVKPVSGDCNLACTYCFYRRVPDALYPGTGVHRMSPMVLERLISSYLGYGFSPSVFCWQGGEPTLAGLDFFRHAVQLEEKHGKKGQVLGNALQTNGLLIDDEWSRFLAQYRFLVGLSIDGPPDVHDAQRTSATGSGSWRLAMRAARRFARDGVEYNILTVVSRANERRGHDIFRWFASQGFAHVQFIPCVESDASGKVTEFSVTPAGFGRFLCDVFDEWMRLGPGRISVRDFDSLLRFHVDGRHDICTFQKDCGSYLLVEHNGDVYPCDFFAMADWRLGNLADRPLHEFFELPKMREFIRTKHIRLQECRGCGWWDSCFAGCQKDRLVLGKMDEHRSYLCESYRMFFEHAEPGFKALAQAVHRQHRAEGKEQEGGSAARSGSAAQSGRK